MLAVSEDHLLPKGIHLHVEAHIGCSNSVSRASGYYMYTILHI